MGLIYVIIVIIANQCNKTTGDRICREILKVIMQLINTLSLMCSKLSVLVNSRSDSLWQKAIAMHIHIMMLMHGKDA